MHVGGEIRSADENRDVGGISIMENAMRDENADWRGEIRDRGEYPPPVSDREEP